MPSPLSNPPRTNHYKKQHIKKKKKRGFICQVDKILPFRHRTSMTRRDATRRRVILIPVPPRHEAITRKTGFSLCVSRQSGRYKGTAMPQPIQPRLCSSPLIYWRFGCIQTTGSPAFRCQQRGRVSEWEEAGSRGTIGRSRTGDRRPASHATLLRHDVYPTGYVSCLRIAR